jgi:hypothetical protein
MLLLGKGKKKIEQKQQQYHHKKDIKCSKMIFSMPLLFQNGLNIFQFETIQKKTTVVHNL